MNPTVILHSISYKFHLPFTTRPDCWRNIRFHRTAKLRKRRKSPLDSSDSTPRKIQTFPYLLPVFLNLRVRHVRYYPHSRIKRPWITWMTREWERNHVVEKQIRSSSIAHSMDDNCGGFRISRSCPRKSSLPGVLPGGFGF